MPAANHQWIYAQSFHIAAKIRNGAGALNIPPWRNHHFFHVHTFYLHFLMEYLLQIDPIPQPRHQHRFLLQSSPLFKHNSQQLMKNG